jgi:hypothetical protein
MEFLKQYTNKLRSMNGTTDSNGMPSQGDQELKQKEDVNEKTGTMQKVTGFLQNLIQPFPGNEENPMTPTGSKLIKGPDGKLYDENLIKQIGGFDMQELERRRKIMSGM